MNIPVFEKQQKIGSMHDATGIFLCIFAVAPRAGA